MSINFPQSLNQEQLDVVLHGDGACLVLAGAGTGKTRALTYRVAYLLEHGVDPSSILLLTFTNKAAREMLSRVSQLVGQRASQIWGGTFHSIASRLLRHFCQDVGYEPNFSILDSEDSRDLIKAILKEAKVETKQGRFPSTQVVQDVISFARNTQQSISDTLEIKYPHFLGVATDIEFIASQYQERKKTANVMDFDDLLTNFASILLSDKGLGISQAFRYVLVDEYQDTNALQARLVQALAPVHKNILVVGDDAQSIYAFRGADVKNMLSFPDAWLGTKIFRLVTNYRSTPEILELANASLSNNQHQFEKELVAVCSRARKPKIVACASASEEARFVADELLRIHAEQIPSRRMAVLFRSSGHSQALEFELMKRDIPYEYRGGQKFFDRAHIKDALAYLRVLANPHDEIAWLRVLGLQAGIGVSGAAMIASLTRRISQFEDVLAPTFTALLPSRAQNGWQDFCAQAESMRKEPLPGQMIRRLCLSKYRDYLEAEYPNWRERLEDLEQLSFFADAYDDLTRFLSDIELYDDVVARQENGEVATRDNVILSTIHQAKGLEWHTVFVIHLADQAFPNRRAMQEEGGLEEERRLFYVAVTRAEKQLYLTYPLASGCDVLTLNQVSMFLDELPPQLCERVETRSRPHGVSTNFFHRPHHNDWSEPVIEIGHDGERKASSPTVWKSLTNKKPDSKKRSFLRDVEDL